VFPKLKSKTSSMHGKDMQVDLASNSKWRTTHRKCLQSGRRSRQRRSGRVIQMLRCTLGWRLGGGSCTGGMQISQKKTLDDGWAASLLQFHDLNLDETEEKYFIVIVPGQWASLGIEIERKQETSDFQRKEGMRSGCSCAGATLKRGPPYRTSPSCGQRMTQQTCHSC